jgi:hypothetical protein
VLSLLPLYKQREGVRCQSSCIWLGLASSCIPTSAVRRRVGLRRSDEGQGHDHPQVYLSIRQCSTILPRPWIPTHDNLVSVLPGSPTMPLAVGTGSRTETAITMECVAMRPDRLILWRPRVAGRRCNRIVIRLG